MDDELKRNIKVIITGPTDLQQSHNQTKKNIWEWRTEQLLQKPVEAASDVMSPESLWWQTHQHEEHAPAPIHEEASSRMLSVWTCHSKGRKSDFVSRFPFASFRNVTPACVCRSEWVCVNPIGHKSPTWVIIIHQEHDVLCPQSAL